MTGIEEHMSPVELEALRSPANRAFAEHTKDLLQRAVAGHITGVDVFAAGDTAAAYEWWAKTIDKIVSHSQAERDSMLAHAVQQLATYVLRDRVVEANPPIPDTLIDEAERYAAQVEADEPPC